MTTPAAIDDVVGKLNIMADTGRRMDGGGSIAIGPDGKVTCEMWGSEPVMALRNPDGPAAATLITSLAKERDEARENVDHLMHVIDRDRYIVAHGATAVESECRAREWLLTGRGPYEWDDDDYRKEFGDALNAIRAGLDPLRKVAWDKSDCTRIEERVVAAKAAASELLKQPIGNREMISADLLGHPATARADAAEREVERVREDLEQIHQFASKGHPLRAGFMHGQRVRKDMEADLLSIAAIAAAALSPVGGV